MIDLPVELGDDSEDLTDQEVERAIALPNVDRVIAHLRDLCCECSKSVQPVKHELRRRTPSLYWRMQLKCGLGHEMKVVFRIDWLHEST